MKVEVDQELCISCGLCINTCPDVFEWNDDQKAEAVAGEVGGDVESATHEAVEGCPTSAIVEN